MSLWVCCASGPSMRKEDIDFARQAGAKVLVVNTTYQLCHDADALFAMDWEWWRRHGDAVKRDFKGKRYTTSGFAARKFDCWKLHRRANNSGSMAILLAESFGASKILLLGYDGQGGHWHPPHEGDAQANSNRLHKMEHRRIAGQFKVPVLNCASGTAVDAFPVATLKEALCPSP